MSLAIQFYSMVKGGDVEFELQRSRNNQGNDQRCGAKAAVTFLYGEWSFFLKGKLLCACAQKLVAHFKGKVGGGGEVSRSVLLSRMMKVLQPKTIAQQCPSNRGRPLLLWTANDWEQATAYLKWHKASKELRDRLNSPTVQAVTLLLEDTLGIKDACKDASGTAKLLVLLGWKMRCEVGHGSASSVIVPQQGYTLTKAGDCWEVKIRGISVAKSQPGKDQVAFALAPRSGLPGASTPVNVVNNSLQAELKVDFLEAVIVAMAHVISAVEVATTGTIAAH